MKFKIRPIFINISITFIAHTLVLLSFFFIYKLIGKNYGPDGIGEYALIKKIISFLSPFFLLGLWVGLPHYIAMSKDKNQRAVYLKAAGIIVFTLTLSFLIIINIFNLHFAKIFFGDINYANLVSPLSFLLVGLVFYYFIYSYFRGRLLVKTFNFFQVVNSALVPLVILILFKRISIEKFIILIGLINFTIAFIFSLSFAKEFIIPISKKQFKSSISELIRYSSPRFLASIFYVGLLFLGPILATHFTSIREVGYLSLSQSLLGSITIVITPLGLILLPKVSILLFQKRENEIKENLNYLIGAIIQCSIFLCIQLIIFADIIIKIWLGPQFINTIFISVLRIVFLSLIFYLFYGSMASILEASRFKPINFINLCISFGIFLIISGILLFLIKLSHPIISLGIAFTSGLLCLGLSTYISIRKIYPEKIKKDSNYLLIAIGVNILLGSMALLYKSFLVSRFYYLIIFEISLAFTYLLILWLLKMEWLRKAPEKILLKIGGGRLDYESINIK